MGSNQQVLSTYGGVVIPPIAPTPINDWNIASIVAADNDPVVSWVDTVAGNNVTGAGSVRPLYKTGITPKGSAVLRFDGIDDTLTSATNIISMIYIFMIAAYRPASSNTGNNPFSTSGGYFWDSNTNLIFDFVSGFGNAFRNGVDTDAYYGSGQFALYEFNFVSVGAVTDVPIFARDRTQPTYGAWDIARLIAYNREITGTELTNTRSNLTSTYL